VVINILRLFGNQLYLISARINLKTKMGYRELCIAACRKNSNFGRGASLQSIKKYVAANNNGKCVASAVRKCLATDSFVQGASKARWVATQAAADSIKPKK